MLSNNSVETLHIQVKIITDYVTLFYHYTKERKSGASLLSHPKQEVQWAFNRPCIPSFVKICSELSEEMSKI